MTSTDGSITEYVCVYGNSGRNHGKEGKATETKLEKGRKLIRELLDDKKEISIRELDEKAKEQRISGRTMRDVRSRMKNELEYRVNEKQENSIRLKE